jgi:hypothetical protein
VPPAPPTEAPAPRPPEAAPPPPPPPTPNPLTVGGYFRSYYFTRQNASNNPGTQFNFSPGAKYVSNGVNQATWNSAIAPHVDYAFAGGGWDVGFAYLYANPISGPCVVPANHAKGAVCVSQTPPNTNADDTVPGFTMSTLYQAYLKYKDYGFDGSLGNILFTSPWANPSDSRLKPVAFQGGDLGYTNPSGWNVEAADMLTFQNRTSSAFTHQTLLTSYPAGGGGLASNIFVPGGQGINTNGFVYGKAGYTSPMGFSVNGYFWNVSDLVNQWWGDGKYTFGNMGFAVPFIALQGGWENNSGQSYIGKISSQVFGAQLGATFDKNFLFTVAYNEIPWHADSVFLPKNVTCNNFNHQISASGTTLAYFLPLNAGQCSYNSTTGLTQVYYGGWASPYTDNYATDPLFTTSIDQGMADRRSPGSAYKTTLTWTSTNKRWVFLASYAWYNYGNALIAQETKDWNLDGQYHFSQVTKGPYHGLLLRYRYMDRSLSNTYCGAAATSCPPGATVGSSLLGGLPLFKYNRAQLEYDF